MALSPEFWRGRRVLLTGHTGFKGAWLALWLKRLGAELAGFALAPPTEPNLFDRAAIGTCLTDLRGDLRNLEAVSAALQSHRPEVVIHMAAQSLVRAGYEDPVSTYAVNVMGTVHLLEAARRCDAVRAVVAVTSDKCYRDSVSASREADALGGHDPYSSSKGCAELVADAYRQSYCQSAPAIATARAGNVIGAGDWAADRLIPDMARARLARRVLSLRNPAAIRPWQHVLEPLAGYLLLAERLVCDGQQFAQAWNFGPPESDAATVETVVRKFSALWPALDWRVENAPHPPEASRLTLDCSKARTVLGWHPRLSLDDALEWTVAAYRAESDGASLRGLCEEQIARYESLARP